eukprot:TRINITY_DN5619_c0_g1_i1.p1 TRINITY_DN5619_c0_g1~~TRINITY_DN5619_c0_g1_i1.p1  ORF type:complete len:528 (-),score=79.81 TRINITY_DN5619_c0_g1_i1:829-2412(-)
MLALQQQQRKKYYSDEAEDGGVQTVLKRNYAAGIPIIKENGDSSHPIKASAIIEADELDCASVHKIWCMIHLDTAVQSSKLNVVTQVDFVVVIDHSSSMSLNRKLAFVKATIQFFISKLTEAHRFCLIEFNHDIHMVTDGLLVMNEANKQKVLTALKEIRPEGSTNISGALFTAVNVIRNRCTSESSRISTVMLFTDGLANVGLRGSKFIDQVKSMDIPVGLSINTFGYGIDHDSRMLQNVSLCSNGGVYYYIETTESISATFGECLAGLLNTVAHNITLRIQGEDGCRLVCFYTKFPLVENVSVKDYSISLGSLYNHESRSVLMKLSLRKFKETRSHRLLKLSVSYVNTITLQNNTIEADVTVARPACPPPRPFPTLLDKHINRWTAAIALDDAAARASQNDFPGAQKRIWEAIKTIQDSTSAKDDVQGWYCQDLISDLKEVMAGMEDDRSYVSGIHYLHAFATMYYLERSTGTCHLKGLSTESAGTVLKHKRKNMDYGYKTWEQDEASTAAIREANQYVQEYISD